MTGGVSRNVYGADHVVVNCSDVEASLRWYTECLGLTPERVDEWRAGTAPFPSVRAGAEFVVDLFATAPTGMNVDHFCLVADLGTVEAIATDPALDVVEGPVERWGARGTGTSVYVRDPDGTVVEIRSYDRR